MGPERGRVCPNGPTREEAVAMALEQHYGIRLSGPAGPVSERVAAGAAQVDLTAGGTNVTDQTENPSTFLPIATESQSVSPGLRCNGRSSTAWRCSPTRTVWGSSRSAEGNVELMVESTASRVDRYDNVLVQEESLKVLQAAMDLTQERLARLDASLALGTARTFDRLQFENALLNDSAAWLRQRVASRAARRNLNLLLAATDDQVWALTSALLAPAATGDMALAQAGLPANECPTRCWPCSWPKSGCGRPRRVCLCVGLDRQLGQHGRQSRAVSDLPPRSCSTHTERRHSV